MDWLFKMLIGLAILIGFDFIIIRYASQTWTREIGNEIERIADKYISLKMKEIEMQEDKERRWQEWEQWKEEHRQ